MNSGVPTWVFLLAVSALATVVAWEWQALEARVRTAEVAVVGHDRDVAVLQSQYTEIIERLARIERQTK